MPQAVRAFFIVALAAMFAVSVDAATYIVPSDAEMIQKSDHIVIATGVRAVSERDGRGSIVTRYTLHVEESLKGGLPAGAELVLTEDSGIVGGIARMIAGTPEYEPGVRYLVFASTNRDFEPTTFSMSLGQFRFVEDRGRTLAVRLDIHGYDQNFEPYEESARDAQRFATYIRDTVAQRGNIHGDYFVADARQRQIAAEWEIETNAFTRNSYLMQNGGRGFRWEDPTADFVRSGAQPGPGDGAQAVGVAFSQWNSTASDIDYSDAGVNNSATTGLQNDDGTNSILFNDPNNEIDDASSVAGRGGVFASHQYNFDGETFLAVFEGDVVMANKSITQTCMNGVMTHEVGHTLGFRHSNQPPAGGENTSSAIMNSSVSCGLNGVLQTYDRTAAETVYGDGPVCNPPSITTHPTAVTNITLGATTQLSVVAAGTTPLSYQWYSGTSPDTTTPIPGATTDKLNVTPQVAGTFHVWVRVSNTCTSGPAANSNTAAITATCANPAITGQSANVTINEGNSTQLSVTATGTGLVYQWYEGVVGDTSQPRGTNSNKLTVSPSSTRSYWVNVSGSCGSAVRSSVFVVTVTPCAALTINAPTVTPGAGVGTFTLNVSASSASNPLSYEWFRGTTPGAGGTKIASTPSTIQTVTVATSFWARVTNACGRSGVTGLVTLAPCTLPTITSQPADQSINANQTAQLSIGVSAGATVTWYRGTVGDTTTQIGTGAAVTTPALAETSLFWAQVSNTCGPISSRQVTVTVAENQLSELVSLLNGRFFVQVRYKNQFDNGKEGKLLGRSLFNTALSETAVFTFGDPLVVELMVRVSDARPFDDNIHIFLGGLSDVEFFVVVTDSHSGIVKEYGKPANQLVGVIDRTTFPAAPSLQSGLDSLMAKTVRNITPTAESSTILLLNNRFEVRMRYRNQFTNPPGEGYMNARSIASSPTTETAVFFFDENVGSVEWMVRFSDARPFANRIDLFHGGLSDVEFTIEVHDTQTGVHKEYHKDPFSLNGQVDRDTYLP